MEISDARSHPGGWTGQQLFLDVVEVGEMLKFRIHFSKRINSDRVFVLIYLYKDIYLYVCIYSI